VKLSATIEGDLRTESPVDGKKEVFRRSFPGRQHGGTPIAMQPRMSSMKIRAGTEISMIARSDADDPA